jgi:predicted unusual protein kinase regulating ubiquinone biosynthesis (AarF/ABC1/UbiB family)
MRFNPRYLRIVLFFGRVVLGVVFWDILLRNIGLRSFAKRTAPGRYTAAARRFRALAIRMGGVLIKVGQFLSARVDVLPEHITGELSDLQDEVPPENFEAIKALAEAELGAPLSERFASFDESPLAAASLGQAHKATLRTGEKVVVKIQRPDIDHIVEIDLAAHPVSRCEAPAKDLAGILRWASVQQRAVAPGESATRFTFSTPLSSW